MTHNQDVLPLYLNMGKGPGWKLVVVSVGSISMCYRGLSPLNQNVARRGETGHAQCGINFPLVATVGSPVVVVCDTFPGSTNLTEGIVLY